MKLLLQAIAWAADAALTTCWPVATPPSIGEQWLWEIEAEDEAWEMNELRTADRPHYPLQFIPQTASTDGAVSDPAVECSPAAANGPSSAAAGHPNVNQRRLHAAAAHGLRDWLDGEPCKTPVYFASIVRDLEQFTK